MKTHLSLRTCWLTLALLGATTSHAATMTRAEHSAAEERIEAASKTERNACNALMANAKDVCVQQAIAKEKVSKAELKASHTGKTSDQDKVRLMRADTAYDVAKEMCDDKSGNDKDVCIQEAKAVQAKSRADTKMNETVRDAKAEDALEKRDADYKVAAEKCDPLSGDAKSSCMAQAKTRYGKQ